MATSPKRPMMPAYFLQGSFSKTHFPRRHIMMLNAVLGRAHSAVGQGIRYKLGKGGMNPGSPTPAAGMQCDCTGFVAWCFGFSRKMTEHFYVQFNNGWFETTAVWTDIGTSTGILEESQSRQGAVIVFPDSNGHQGHIGIILDDTHVVHCSKGNDTKFGDSIQVTDLAVFQKPNRRIGWLVGLT
jgi:hypothetical protein